MKIRFINQCEQKYLTIGYWRWTEPNNRGELIVEVSRMSSKRFMLAVLGHELIEIFYCWLFHITTEQADEFDEMYERGYADGTISKEAEPGHDRKCPYHWGHMAGVLWEHVWIRLSFASWKKYLAECDKLMGIDDSPIPGKVGV